MARKTLKYTADTGRDAGKAFLITEMPAAQAERWTFKAFLAIGSAGVEIPDNVAALGMVGLVTHGIQTLLKAPYDKLEPLLDEMMTCVQAMPNPDKPNILRALHEDDIEEVTTRLALRKAIIGLHTDFFGDGGIQTTASDHRPSEPVSSSATKTPPFSSPRRSQRK